MQNILDESYLTTTWGTTLSSLRIGKDFRGLLSGKTPIIMKFKTSAGGKRSRTPSTKKKKQSNPEEEDIMDDDAAENSPERPVLQVPQFNSRPLPEKSAVEQLRNRLIGELFDLRDSIFQEDKQFGVAGTHGDNSAVILADTSIRQMAKVLPKNVSDLSAIDGVGKTRADKYGPRFLRHIVAYCQEHPELNPKVGPAPTKTTKTIAIDDPTNDPDFEDPPKKFLSQSKGTVSAYFEKFARTPAPVKTTKNDDDEPSTTTKIVRKRSLEAVPLSQATTKKSNVKQQHNAAEHFQKYKYKKDN
jgi:hypothetical protein